MINKNNSSNAGENNIEAMNIITRQMEATVSLVQYFYQLLISYRKSGISVYSISYLLDLMCQYLMSFYGGNKEIIAEIKKTAEEELKLYCKPGAPLQPPSDLDLVKKELKELGINFNVVYDPKTHTTYPNVDLNQIHIPENVIDDWMKKHMDKVLDSYLEKKRQLEQKDETNKEKEPPTEA